MNTQTQNTNNRTARIVYVWKDDVGPCELRLERMRREKVDGVEKDVVFLSQVYPVEMQGLVETYARDWIEAGIRDEGEFNFGGVR